MVKALSIPEVIDRQYKLLNISAAFPPNPNGAQRKIGGSGEHMVTAALGGVIQPMMGNLGGLQIARVSKYT